MQKIRIVLADDHVLVRSGLRILIGQQADMEVVGEAGDFTAAFEQVKSLSPDVLTLDLTMPGNDGLQGIEKVVHQCPKTSVLVLTMHDDPAYLRSALALGAKGYIVKSAGDAELVNAIRAVYAGQTFIDSQHMATASITPPRNRRHSAAPIDTLSDREREVLNLIAHGHTNQKVADQLGLSVKTIESYRARLMEKLGLANRADLTRLAIETGLLKVGPDAVS